LWSRASSASLPGDASIADPTVMDIVMGITRARDHPITLGIE